MTAQQLILEEKGSMLLYLCMAEYHDPVLYVINNMFRDMHETNLIIRDIFVISI